MTPGPVKISSFGTGIDPPFFFGKTGIGTNICLIVAPKSVKLYIFLRKCSLLKSFFKQFFVFIVQIIVSIIQIVPYFFNSFRRYSFIVEKR